MMARLMLALSLCFLGYLGFDTVIGPDLSHAVKWLAWAIAGSTMWAIIEIWRD